jgi:hypothetical protein
MSSPRPHLASPATIDLFIANIRILAGGYTRISRVRFLHGGRCVELRKADSTCDFECGILVNREAKTRSTYTGHFQLNMLHDNDTKQQHMVAHRFRRFALHVYSLTFLGLNCLSFNHI